MIIESNVIKYQDNVDTDVIIPARYLNDSSDENMAKHCMEDLDPNYHERVKENKIVVAGFNFGCGSSREHAPLALKASGAKLVIAKSFARIFYRNAINIGMPIIECEAAAEAIENGDLVSVDTETGLITDKTTGETFKAAPFPGFIGTIIADGGLVEAIKKGSIR